MRSKRVDGLGDSNASKRTEHLHDGFACVDDLSKSVLEADEADSDHCRPWTGACLQQGTGTASHGHQDQNVQNTDDRHGVTKNTNVAACK